VPGCSATFVHVSATCTACLRAALTEVADVGRLGLALSSGTADCAAAGSERPAVVASLSARVGSISDNELGGWYSYRCALSRPIANTMTTQAAGSRISRQCLLAVEERDGSLEGWAVGHAKCSTTVADGCERSSPVSLLCSALRQVVP